MTARNRKEVTLRCLRHLVEQEGVANLEVRVFLVDDGSSDGTGDAVRNEFPQAVTLYGDGSLFWTGGMLRAEERALLENPDYFLWLNDDVLLERDCLSSMMSVSMERNDQAIVVGSVCDGATGRVTYGGHRQTVRNRPLRLTLVQPNGAVQLVDTMNGNVVLVPRVVRDTIGPLDRRFHHNLADHDYGFRARGTGFDVVITPAFVGVCQRNTGKHTWKDPTVRLRQRWAAVVSEKGLPPAQWLTFTRRYAGWRWPLFFTSPYVRALLAPAMRSPGPGAETP